MVEHFPSIHKALGSIVCEKEEEEKEEKEEEEEEKGKRNLLMMLKQEDPVSPEIRGQSRQHSKTLKKKCSFLLKMLNR
jgi:hypothetical protein